MGREERREVRGSPSASSKKRALPTATRPYRRGREGGKEGGREGGKEGGREGGREGRREGGREGGVPVSVLEKSEESRPHHSSLPPFLPFPPPGP